jgi:UPF0755 protein
MTLPGRRIPLPLIILLIFPLLWLLWLGMYIISPGPTAATERIEVFIPPRTSLSGIEKILAAEGVIHDDPRFTMLALLTGAASRLRAGEYAFFPEKKPLEIIRQLKEGKVFYRPVTIPEGTELAGVAAILAAGDWVDKHRFLELGRDPELLAEAGITAESFEGYLFPDTYLLSKSQLDEAGIIRMMVKRQQQVFAEIVGGVAAIPQGLTPHEVITLASIVEKETGIPAERPLVASVFLNRLAKNMRLQADPTVRYGLQNKTEQLTRRQLTRSSPYNTYLVSGLPPGPIANPGRASIEAVLFPAQTDYLYFVAKDGQSHHFSRSLKEHNRAVAKFRKTQ